MDEERALKLMGLRELLKSTAPIGADGLSDEKQDLPQPPLELCRGGETIALPRDFGAAVRTPDILTLLERRESRRKYTDAPLTLLELSYLLWATQGVKRVIGNRRRATMRTVPSAGARHGLETYLFVNRVEGLAPGLYHYLPLEHRLEQLGPVDNQADLLTMAYGGQTFFSSAAVDFVWTAVPYRMEWRYGDHAAKFLLLDAGHVCENLYLTCESLDLGACAIGAYTQDQADGLLGLKSGMSWDRDDEFVVYAACVGRVE